ncbi:MAG: hypothetical protein AAF697_00525 [Pseudomonadota bacterium]
MDVVEENLANWGGSLFQSIPLAGLISRNAIAYKWKSLYRVWMLRELTLWREHDVLVQSHALYKQGHGLGARTLLRSGLETLATLTFLNMLMQDVLDGKVDFHTFSEKTAVLLLGSRNNDAMPLAINILTVLGKCDKRYPGIMKLYTGLSESTHPNYEGLMCGYSKTDYDEYETTFSNLWMENLGGRHLDEMMFCIETFYHEYNTVWSELIVKLEEWVEANDADLERTKPNSA